LLTSLVQVLQMPRYFTHYWSNSTWEGNRDSEGENLDHAASNQFRKRGVRPGDFVYVVTVEAGQILLAGRMQVDRVVSRDEAMELLGTDDLWDAEDQVIAAPGTGLPMRFDRPVPLEVTRRIRFLVGGKDEPLVFRTPTRLDQQTLRGVRQLSPDSARLLDELLDVPGTPRGEEALDRGWDEALTEWPLDLDTLEDERRRTLASVVQRQGQEDFRRALLRAYNGRCAISGCDVESALQAAHIIPYLGPHSNRSSNGLLLRADLHNLFDLGLLWIDPETLTVRLAPSLKGSCYGHLDGKGLAVPDSPSERPNPEVLRRRQEGQKRLFAASESQRRPGDRP
jgi:hypothetical protein